MQRKPVSLVGAAFIGSPLLFVVPGILLHLGVSPVLGFLIGAVAAMAGGYLLLRSI